MTSRNKQRKTALKVPTPGAAGEQSAAPVKAVVFRGGDRIRVTKPGLAIGSLVRLKLGDRGVVTQADPTGDIVTVNFEFRHVPGGLRVWCASIELIPHDPPTPKAAE